MRRFRNKVTYISLLFLLQLLPCMLYAANDAANAPDKREWRQLTNDAEYNRYKNKVEFVKPPEPPKDNTFRDFFLSIFEFFGSTLGRTILWASIFLIILWAVYKIFFADTRFFSKKSEVQPRETDSVVIEQEHLLTTNWEQKVNEALAQNDLRQAIRNTYMWLLQLMQQKELIQYAEGKTNYDYYQELNETDYKQPFKKISRRFEYAWYGMYPVSKEAYQEYTETFKTIKNRLKP